MKPQPLLCSVVACPSFAGYVFQPGVSGGYAYVYNCTFSGQPIYVVAAICSASPRCKGFIVHNTVANPQYCLVEFTGPPNPFTPDMSMPGRCMGLYTKDAGEFLPSLASWYWTHLCTCSSMRVSNA